MHQYLHQQHTWNARGGGGGGRKTPHLSVSNNSFGQASYSYSPITLSTTPPLQIFSENHPSISNRQSQTAARRANGTDLADLAHGTLVLHVVFDAIVWAARAGLAGVDGRE